MIIYDELKKYASFFRPVNQTSLNTEESQQSKVSNEWQPQELEQGLKVNFLKVTLKCYNVRL